MKSPEGICEEDDRPSSGVKDHSGRSPISDKLTSDKRTLSLEQRIDLLVRKVHGTFEEDLKKRLGIASEE